MSARFAALMQELVVDAPAIPATLATRAAEPLSPSAYSAPVSPQEVAKSRESQPSEDRSAKVLAIRQCLLLNSHNLGIDASVLAAISVPEIESIEGKGTQFIESYLYALRDSALRAKGKVPGEETVPAMCRKCGPVWLAPEVAAVAPVVEGWPCILGCPYCHVKNRSLISRPLVACAGCEHFLPDSVNPAGGIGKCTVGHDGLPGEPLMYPSAKRQCAEFNPRRPT